MNGGSKALDVLDLGQTLSSPVVIKAIDLLRYQKSHLLRVRSADGAIGIAPVKARPYLFPILKELVIPFFLGKDARQLQSLIEGVYLYRSNYKLSGLAFWHCVAHVEFSIFDLIGKMAAKPVCELLGTVRRKKIPVYLSSLRRDTTPEEEVEWLCERVQQTGARAIKIKVGGRMSKNADAFPGRTDQLIPLARETFGQDCTIYVDANGSYDADGAIEVGRLLEDHQIAFFEEPCPFEELEMTKRVTAALTIPVAGGEQDASLPRFDWMIRNRVVDIVQPDLAYNGGFIRALKVARMAEQAGLPITPHSPSVGAHTVYVLHFAAVVPNAGPFHEFRGEAHPVADWYAPSFLVRDGVIDVPTKPGWGIEYDPVIWRDVEVL